MTHAHHDYVPPSDPAVAAKVRAWQDLKFGIIVHFGLYSEVGCVESWGMCPEPWVKVPGDDHAAFARGYRAAKSRFNPTKLDAAQWARTFRAAGAGYVIFTAKHHDGFCLFDSAHTRFKVTDAACPFSRDPRADVFRQVAEACRAEGLRFGAYFSKPDWDSPGFWGPGEVPTDRNPTYDVTREPARWEGFVRFTHAQVDELMSNYGPIDFLWLDGCWVRPMHTIDDRVREFCTSPHDLDIRMSEIAANARARQPGLVIVDRWVPGEFENYLTPEQRVPAEPVPVPWESCITIGRDWGWTPGDAPKPLRELVSLLVRVVAKGGNLLLGIGPRGDGSIEPAVLERLAQLGEWMQANGQAIVGSRPIAPFEQGQVAYLRGADGATYAFHLPAAEAREVPEVIELRGDFGAAPTVEALGGIGPLEAQRTGAGLLVRIPHHLRARMAETMPAIRIAAASATG